MPDSVRRRIVGVAFDIDDTVTRAGKLERVAFDAMWELHDRGIRLIAVTGRPIGWVHVVARHWPVDLAIGENGAGWVWFDGRRTHEGFFHDELARRAQAERLAAFRRLVAERLPVLESTADDWARRCDVAWDVGEIRSVEPQVLREFEALVLQQGLRASISSVHAHAIPGDWSKAAGLVRSAREVLGADLDRDRDRWFFVGDSGNDAEAFAWFPHSIGVANVQPWLASLPAPPAWICSASHGAGFAEASSQALGCK